MAPTSRAALLAALTLSTVTFAALADPPRRAQHTDDEDEDVVTVRSRRAPGAATTASFRAQELTTAPGTGTDPTRIVASQPGVARTPFGVGFFAVRGTSYENTGFVLDGFPITNLYHFAGGPSVVPPNLVGSLDFFPGGYPSEYGRYAGAVVVVDTAAPRVDGVRWRGELSIFGLGLGVAAPFASGRGNVVVGARRSYYELLLPLFISGLTIEMGDAHARVEYRLSDRTRVSLFALGVSDVYDRRATRNVGGATTSNRDGITSRFVRLIARAEHRASPSVQLSASAMVGYDQLGYFAGDTGRADSGVSSQGISWGARASVRAALGRWMTAQAGVDALGNQYEGSLSFPARVGLPEIPSPQTNREATEARGPLDLVSVAPYVETALRAGRVELTAGARLDLMTYAQVRTAVADPRAVLRVRLSDHWLAVAASGWFHQQPAFYTLLPLVGNPSLPPTRAWQSSAGVEAVLPASFSGRATVYYTDLASLPRPTQTLVVSDQGSLARVGLLGDGRGRAYGFEFQLRRRIDHGVYGWVSYTLSRSERWVEGGPVVPSALDQTHVLAAALSWEINPRWTVGARFSLGTGAPTNAVQGSIYDADANAWRPNLVPEGDRLPLFHQLDVRVDYRFRWGPARMNAYLDLLNAYASAASEGYNYRYDYSERTKVSGLPTLPVLGLRGEL